MACIRSIFISISCVTTHISTYVIAATHTTLVEEFHLVVSFRTLLLFAQGFFDLLGLNRSQVLAIGHDFFDIITAPQVHLR